MEREQLATIAVNVRAEQVRQLRELSRETGISISDMARQAFERFLSDTARRRAISLPRIHSDTVKSSEYDKEPA